MGDRGAMRETFARQAIPMVWDYAEANPFSDAGGNLGLFLERIVDTVTALPSRTHGVAKQLDASTGNNGVISPLISADHPYYDNIVYCDLSDFFYVWLRRSLSKVYPTLFNTMLVPKGQELVVAPYRFGGDRDRARHFFEEGLGKSFSHMRATAHPDYPLTVYYAFRQAESDEDDEDRAVNGSSVVASAGWDTMLGGLLKASFAISGTWPMRTESAGRAVARGTNALASSIVLVCRPRPESAPMAARREFE
jgi:putative DNA methylase